MELGSAPDAPVLAPSDAVDSGPGEWSWPPEAPLHPAEGARFSTAVWAPPTVVRHPWVRVGRWTLLYRRHRRWSPSRRRGC